MIARYLIVCLCVLTAGTQCSPKPHIAEVKAYSEEEARAMVVEFKDDYAAKTQSWKREEIV